MEKMRETIGERFLRREVWDCDECSMEFELGAAWFDPMHGIVCPKCKSGRVGPKRDTAVN
jgi:hypothetical protein